MAQSKGDKEDGLRNLADHLRGKNGVDYGTAKLEMQAGEATWVEYFRGKDFVRYLKEKPDLMAPFVKPLTAGIGTSEEPPSQLRY
eukprot:jgi/Chrzof1/12409/Cz06g33130.t1